MTTSIISQHSSYDCMSTGELWGGGEVGRWGGEEVGWELMRDFQCEEVNLLWLPVSRNVDLANYIKQKGLLNTRVLCVCVCVGVGGWVEGARVRQSQ